MVQKRTISIHSAVNQTPCVTNITQDANVSPAIVLQQDGTKTGRGTVNTQGKTITFSFWACPCVTKCSGGRSELRVRIWGLWA